MEASFACLSNASNAPAVGAAATGLAALAKELAFAFLAGALPAGPAHAVITIAAAKISSECLELKIIGLPLGA